MRRQSELTPAQRKAAGLAARGVPGRQIAAEVGCREETVSRWKALPQFQAEVERVLETIRRGDLEDRVHQLAEVAVDVLGAILTSQRPTPIELRAQAASALLRFAAALRRRDPAPAGGEPAP